MEKVLTDNQPTENAKKPYPKAFDRRSRNGLPLNFAGLTE